MIGETLSHYRITAKLGEGGMGEVYLAEDTELDRQVAIKVLPSELSEDQERLERFKREAKAVAALNHPNIVTIYSIEENEGRRFLIMELVEGESLDRVLPPSGLPLVKVFDIAIPLADALSSAHEKGIVHRDLKPANVMVTPDGHIKVLDFGLAKLAAETGKMPADADATQMAPSSATLTREGVVMGTAPYMSPEQLQGQTVDHRSDIFSLGVMLYEMVCGSRPFRGENSAALVSSIMRDTPIPVFEQRADLPRHLGRIIQHSLEKDPRERFQTALDVRNELKSLQKEIESGSNTSLSGVAATPAAPQSGVATTPQSTPASGAPSVPVSAVPQAPVTHNAPAVPPAARPTAPPLPQAPRPTGPDPGSRSQQPSMAATPVSGAPVSNASAVAPAKSAIPSGPVQPVMGSGKTKMMGAVAAIVVVALAVGWWLGQGREEEPATAPAEAVSTTPTPEPSPVAGDTPSVAVLPFTDRSPEGDQEYFTDGLSEELINALGRSGNLRVAGRRSSFQFKNSDEDLETIGERLNVTTVLEGSVRKSGDQLRISAQLVSVDDGFQLWSETYDRSLDDIFEVQDEIASSVATALKVSLLEESDVVDQNVSTDAYNLLLQAKFLLGRSSRAENDKAIETLSQALELDPEYAAAWAELGLAYNRQAFVAESEEAREEAVDQGRKALERSLEIDPELPEALSRMGWVLGSQELDFVAADAFTQRALAVAPNNSIVLGNASSMANIFGRIEEAIELNKRGLEIDPLDLTKYGNGANTFLNAGRYREALDYYEKLQMLSPDYTFLHSGFGSVYLAQGRLQEAREEFEKEPDSGSKLSGLAMVYHSLGDTDASNRAFEEFKEELGRDNPYVVAGIHGFRGEIDRAFEFLDRAYIFRDPGLSGIKTDPALENLHPDPRWEPFLAKMGLGD